MKRFCLFLAVAVMGLLVFAGNGTATIIGGPGPPGYGNDDGTELFVPSQQVVSLELYDLLGDIYPTSFGFYFESDPTTLIGIFGPGDQGPVPSPFDFQTASIDFSTGIVSDLDDGSTQATFTPGMGNIGFLCQYNLPAVGLTLYTQPLLNGGLDAAATFPSLSDPSQYIIGFEIFNPDDSLFHTVSVELVDGINPVPEPSTLLLLGSGLAGLAGFSRKRFKKRT